MNRPRRAPSVTRASSDGLAIVRSLRSLTIVLSALSIGPVEAQMQRTPFLVAGVGLAPVKLGPKPGKAGRPTLTNNGHGLRLRRVGGVRGRVATVSCGRGDG
jgi:hypothetical protein